MAKLIEVVFDAKFGRGLTAATIVYMYFFEATMGLLNSTLYSAHGTESQEVGIGNEHSKRLLDDMEASFASVFMEPTYPV